MKPPKPYALAEYFKEMEVISHPKFGVGYVTENIGDDKIEVTFKEDKRVLVHNRKGLTLPFSMLRPLTPPVQKAKGRKDKAVKPAPAPKPVPEKSKGAARPAAKHPSRSGAAARKPPVKAAAKARPASRPARPPKKVKTTARAARPVRARPAKTAAKKLKKSR